MNIHQKLHIGVVSAVLLLVGIGLISLNRQRQSVTDEAWVSHTQEVLSELQALSAEFNMAEGDQRRFLLIRNPKLLDHLHESQQKALSHFRRIRFLTKDNLREQRRLDRLKPLLDDSFASEEASFMSPGSNPEEAATQYSITSGSDEWTMGQIEMCLREITNEEEVLLNGRLKLLHDSAYVATASVEMGSLLGAVLIALSGLWINRDLRRREQAQAALLQVQAGLEARTDDLSKIAASLEAEVTQHQKTEEQLRQTEHEYRLLFEESPLAKLIFDADTLAFLAANAAAEKLFGYTREEFRKMTLTEIQPSEEGPARMDFLNKREAGGAYTSTFVTRQKTGELITIEARVQAIKFEGRSAQLALITDISEHKRLETQLRQTQKMEAVGNLAGGIAHDFNNLLTVILGYSDSILSKLDPADPMREKVSEIQKAGQRAASLTSQLLAFSRKQILKPRILELNSVITNTTQMLRRLLGEDISISLHLDPSLWQIEADPTQLEQVLVNLSVNARDAMPKGGSLVIESHNLEMDPYRASVQGLAPGQYVMLAVSDTGSGMDEQTKARVFEPFFTTKPIGKGTGLGLPMVLGVVQQSGGTVTIYSEVGVGTTFRIYLPRVDASVTAAETSEPSASWPAQQGAVILLAEDEPSLRALSRELLREAGYVVLEASNGKEALKVASGLVTQPALLLTDVVMPEINGLELAQELQRQWPGLCVLYTSGYTDHSLLERNALRVNMPFLQKPYMPGALLEAVAAALRGDLCIHSEKERAEHRALQKPSEPEQIAQVPEPLLA